MEKSKSYIKQTLDILLDEFSSVRLAITLFIFIAATTLIGTVLPEEPLLGTAELIKRYGENKYNFYKSLGLTDVFHSWWYLALLTALGINLIVGSFKKVFPRCTKAFTFPKPLTKEQIKKLPINCEIDFTDKNILNKFESKLKKKKYTTRLHGENLLLAVKGSWHRLGASITHVGILTILLGGAISIVTGFNGVTQILENEGFYITDLGNRKEQIKSSEHGTYLVPISKMPVWFGKLPNYFIKVNKTWKENYKSGQPKQWYTNISVFDQNKKELIRKTIFVNNPLEFNGLDIYQSSWGKFINVSINNEFLKMPVENFGNEEIIILPITNEIGLKFKLVKKLNKSLLEIYSVLIKNPLKEKYLDKVFINQNIKLGPINIGFYGTEKMTGLQFKSNPGDFLIYPGLFFIICGVFIAFGSKKQIWAIQEKDTNKVIAGGNADRSKANFSKEFENLISELVSNQSLYSASLKQTELQEIVSHF